MKPIRLLALVLLAAAPPALALPPEMLLHSIPPPSSALQSGAQLGTSVAVEGDYTVVGALGDDIGGADSGVVKVFHSTTGELLWLITNPSPAGNDQFGYSVAISGTQIVVGATRDDTGAADAGSVYIYDLSTGTPTVPVTTLNNPLPEATDLFGISVGISGTRVVVGANGDNMGASNAGSAYVYDLSSITPTVPVATLDNPSPAVNDEFGFAVAISGFRVLVASPADDTGATDAGSAYIYDLNSATPAVPVITLNHPTVTAGDRFGRAADISGSRVVVGAYLNDTGAGDSGSAYVYDVSSGNPTVPLVTLNNPTPATGDWFGRAVAVDGTRVVIAAALDNTGASDAGSAYVYDLSSGTPALPVATLNNPSPAVNDQFGGSLTISGTRVVVGAYLDDTGATDAGSAYVYDVSSGTPTVPVVLLNNPGLLAGDNFGNSVAVSGNLMVVGASYLDMTGAAEVGAAYVYDLSSGTPTVPVFTLNNPSPAVSDRFGSSVAISGTRVVVGAYLDDTGAANAGSAYVYDLNSGTPTVPVTTLSNPGPAAGDHFGYSVAISGTRVIVGAYFDDTDATNSGSAYAYDLSSGTPDVPVTTLNNPSPVAEDYFGGSVAISGMRVVVGAQGDNTNAGNAGSAYVYDLSSGTPTMPVATLNNPSPAGNDYFGWSVAISGIRVVVGAVYDDAGATDAGSVYVYDLSSGTPTLPAVTLSKLSPAVSERFGHAVAISGARVVVGANLDDTGATDAGSAYVYDLLSSTPTVPVATLANPAPGANDQFGFCVAIDGSSIVIGTPFDDTAAYDKGYAYVFNAFPEIVVEVLPSNANFSDGGSHDFGIAVTGSTASVTFTLKNIGYNDLILTGSPKVAVSGTHGAMFAITAQPTSPLTAPTGTTTFTVQFLPTSGGVKTAALSIPNNDADESPFDIHLTGTALTFTDDTDADGLNDASEFQMAALGYDWQVSQPALVNTLMSSASGAGLYNQTLYNANRTAGQNDVINSPNTYSLYTLSQVQALNVGTPLIQRHPTTGVFTLTLGVEKSTTLLPGSFTPFPMTAPQTTINGAGKLEFQFTVPDNAAFFQLRAE
jgi:sulfur relay (sulfurtransferase) DsrC/TusE family protein